MSRQNRTLMDWNEGVWLNAPQSSTIEDGMLKIVPEKGRDFWKKTLYGFEFEDGPALLAKWDRNTGVEVSFRLNSFVELYDQAGLLLYHGQEQWIKAGIEMNDGTPQLAVVVTDGYSDWSLTAVPEWEGRKLPCGHRSLKMLRLFGHGAVSMLGGPLGSQDFHTLRIIKPVLLPARRSARALRLRLPVGR